ISSSTAVSDRRRIAATRGAWMRALGTEICGSTREAALVTAWMGTRAAVRPAVSRPSSFRYFARFDLNVSRASLLFGPRFGNALASAPYLAAVDGRTWS